MRCSSTTLAAALLAAPAMGQLNQWAKEAGLLYFGSAMAPGNVNDKPYYDLLRNNTHFGSWTPENDQKWEVVEPQQNVFNYANADGIYRKTRCNKQMLRCHTLVWHSQLPRWVNQGSWTAETITAVMETHIRNVMTHFKGKCYAWDVVNEGLEDDGSYRKSVFYNLLGDSYFAKAFKLAGEIDPDTKLYYNDYNLEYFPAKADGAVRIAKLIQAAGAPIHGIGLQGHMTIGRTPSRENLTWTLNKYTALGLDVAYTELDVRIKPMPANATAYEIQAKEYANIVGSCLDVKRCVGITVWGFSDAHSWIPGTFPDAGDSNLYDRETKPKPAFYSVSSVLAAAKTQPTACPE